MGSYLLGASLQIILEKNNVQIMHILKLYNWFLNTMDFLPYCSYDYFS